MKEFLIDNYIWFLVVAIILSLAMVGYFTELDKKKHPSTPKLKKKTDEELLDLEMKPGVTLQDALNKKSETPPEALTENLIVEEIK